MINHKEHKDTKTDGDMNHEPHEIHEQEWGKGLETPALTPAQWLPKPATSQWPKGNVRFAHRGPPGEGETFSALVALSREDAKRTAYGPPRSA